MQIRLALNLCALYAHLSAPFIPDAAERLANALKTGQGTKADWPEDVPGSLERLPAGHAFEVPDNLFAKISDEDRDTWQNRFSGTS
jgi:methionyl-tRNA synthetase